MKQNDNYKDVDYFDIVKGGNTLLRLEGDQINGKTKKDVQNYIGKKLGNGIFFYSMKIKGVKNNKTGQIRATNLNPKPEDVKIMSNNNEIVLNKINELEKVIAEKGNDTNYKYLLSMQEASYKIQIDFFKSRITELEAELKRANQKIEKLSSEDNTGIDLLGLANMILNKSKLNKAPVLNDQILQTPNEKINKILSRIDFDKVTPEQIDLIEASIEKYKNFIPLKEDN